MTAHPYFKYTENYDFDRKNDKNDDFDEFFLKTMILTKKC